MIYIDDSEPEGELEPAFPYKDVTVNRNVDAYGLYDILSEVGRGKFGTVYRCQEKSTGLKLAAKFVPIPKREDKRNVEREVEIMNSLQHHLIIQLYAAYEYQKMMCVVLELVEGGELFDRVVDDEFVLTERVCVVFIRQVCEAMEFIHRNNILHLDLKPENILCLTQEGNRIKIIDFGLARKFDPDKRLQILFGTPEFVAPEVVNFDCISYGTDMWSVGVICYVLISGLSPFMGETDIETMANVTIAKYDFEDESFSNVSPECMDFIAKLLVKDLSTRMTAAQCMQHKWLQQRPKPPPVVSPKPLNVPPPKLKAATPSPIPANIDDDDAANITDEDNDEEEEEGEAAHETKELDTTKDNLKNFIERWEEHPNSPYVFDVEGSVIAPLSETPYKKPHGAESISSSRVCSPSPCESIDTIITDDEAADGKSDESPSSIATPINESREKLFPITFTAGASNSSGSATPTPTPQQHQQFPSAPHFMFGHKWDEDNFGGSSTNLQQRSIQSYLHTFDRRNSDTNYLLGRRSSGERVNLAEEIRKLSDHLLMLAEINTKLGNEARSAEGDEETTPSDSVLKRTPSNDANNNKVKKSPKAKETSSSSTSSTAKTSKSTKSKSGATTAAATKDEASTKTTKSFGENTSKSTNSVLNSKSSITSSTREKSSSSSFASSTNANEGKSSRISSLSRLQQSIEETPKLINGGLDFAPWRTSSKNSSSVRTISIGNSKTMATTTTTTSSSSMTSSNFSTSAASSSQSSAAAAESAANARRSKFRINQMSRDVPIGLPDTHQSVNLEEAANTTKDCLLHLLEKYNESKCRNPMGRHQSISVDWNVSDNLEYRSMSSINAFFQRHSGNTGAHVRQLQAQLEEKTTPSSGTTGRMGGGS